MELEMSRIVSFKLPETMHIPVEATLEGKGLMEAFSPISLCSLRLPCVPTCTLLAVLSGE